MHEGKNKVLHYCSKSQIYYTLPKAREPTNKWQHIRQLSPKNQALVGFSPGTAISSKFQPGEASCCFLLHVQSLLTVFTCYSSSYRRCSATLQDEYTNNFPPPGEVGKLKQGSMKSLA